MVAPPRPAASRNLRPSPSSTAAIAARPAGVRSPPARSALDQAPNRRSRRRLCASTLPKSAWLCTRASAKLSSGSAPGRNARNGSQAGDSRRRRGMMPALSSEDLPAPEDPRITNGRKSLSARTERNFFKRLRDLPATAIEQRSVGILVAEGRKAREWCWTQLYIDCECVRVEADPPRGLRRLANRYPAYLRSVGRGRDRAGPLQSMQAATSNP